jgi:hypothetical protein
LKYQFFSLIFGVVILSTGCDKLSNSSVSDQPYITGLSNVAIYSYTEASNGKSYQYKSNGRQFQISVAFIQSQLFFDAIDESKNRQRLNPFGLLDEINSDSSKYKIIVGQHDLDFDKTDEIFIAMINPKDSIAINVFKLNNNKFMKINQDPQIIQEFLSQPNAAIKGNTIKINRHLRGFWNIWTLESGRLVGYLDVDENFSTSAR